MARSRTDAVAPNLYRMHRNTLAGTFAEPALIEAPGIEEAPAMGKTCAQEDLAERKG
ncbi:hypothetical protein [Desulfovibrio sp. 86]|uniref:hypothetical protein n=1 Tax=Desulfovibrio sp. 86 TaxID=2666132 RepID=UPI0015D2A802|nr:hypothetical protein [Desulfovibrio sp. 86]